MAEETGTTEGPMSIGRPQPILLSWAVGGVNT